MVPPFDMSSFSPRLSTSHPSPSSSFSTLRSSPSSSAFRTSNSAAAHRQPPQATRTMSAARPLDSAAITPPNPRQVLIVGPSLPSPPPSSTPASPSLKPHGSPTIEATSAPNPVPILPPLLSCPTLDLLTPTYLRNLRGSNPERPLFLRGITPAAFDEWELRFPDHELREADDVRYEYDSVTERLIVKCMPGPIHDSLQIYFVRRIMEEGFRTNSFRSMTVASGTDCTGFSGEWATNSKKLPDAYVQISTDEFPSVVAEAGWSEDLQDLIEDAKMWLLGTDSQTKVVIIVEFAEVKAPADPELDTATEAALLASLDTSTTMKSVAKTLLSLHNNNKIATPLLGAIHATMHVYRLDPATNTPTECFTAVVLPVPDAPEPPFALTMEDIFGTAKRVPDGVAPDHQIVFDLDELREVINVQVPKMEWNRAVARAKKVLEDKGLFEDKDMFAVGKSLKRKGREVEGTGGAAEKKVRGG